MTPAELKVDPRERRFRAIARVVFWAILPGRFFLRAYGRFLAWRVTR